MLQPRVLVLRAPGTNCDGETAYAFERAGAKADAVHINRVLENPALLAQAQILCLPGGFSYGDDIAAGRILATQFRRLAEPLAEFRAACKLVLGICNGFQVMIKTGLLLDVDSPQGPAATLTWNASGKFEDRWVHLRTSGADGAAAAEGTTHKLPDCVFLRGIERLYLPVAHAEGRFVARDPAALAKLEIAGQLVLRYTGATPGGNPADDERSVAYPANPNGAAANVAGICDTTGRVFGLMPHPERHIDETHHPRWTRGEGRPEGDGLRLFRNAVEYFA